MQAKPILSVALAAAISIALAHAVHAEIIYSQTTPKEPIGAFSSLDITGFQKIADNFRISTAEPMTIRSVRLIGAVTNVDDSLPPTDNFRIVFLTDDGGVPGAVLPGGDFSVGTPTNLSFTDGLLISDRYEPMEYSIDLGSGITLDPSQEYWISITNNLGLSNGWLWARAIGVVDQKTAGTRDEIDAGPWEVFENGGMFFELNSENIPEPTSILPTCSGLACLIWLRYRYWLTTRVNSYP